jgi:hypothetical protein
MHIATLEGRQKELSAALEERAAYEPGGNAMELNRELTAIGRDLARTLAEWDAASSAMEATGQEC